MNPPFASARLWRAVLLALVLGVAWLALVPIPPQDLTSGWDKLNHAAAFAAMALVGRVAFQNQAGATVRVGVALFAYGALIEIAQYFVPGRSCEWGDLLGDSIGIVIGLAFAAWRLRQARRPAAASG